MVRNIGVVYFAPGKQLVLSGGLGPLQSLAATGSLTITLSPLDAAHNKATKLELTYAVTGYMGAGMNTLAAPVDSVLKQQLTRLKNYAEHGNAASPPV